MRNAAASLAVLGLLTTGTVVATAGTAQAATHCQGYSTYKYGSALLYKPTTKNKSRNTNCILARGDGYGGGSQLNAVAWLQRSLNRCFGTDLDVDGLYGPATVGAVKTAQRVKGLAQDGVFGPKTSRYMNWARMGSGNTGCTYGGHP
ncbi:peptidoglycan-binding domain-containing protein [Streptomyces poriticola]|uniref:peptidoglycan-binding domain-containing protein n=1 Tax=Streptomyces poriticola TaxID=3120506 RepID=UPI002FCE3B9E